MINKSSRALNGSKGKWEHSQKAKNLYRAYHRNELKSKTKKWKLIDSEMRKAFTRSLQFLCFHFPFPKSD